MDVNFRIGGAEDLESEHNHTARLFATACVLLVVIVGAGVFLFLSARSKYYAIAPKTKTGGYKKLDTNGGVTPQPTTSSFGEYSDRIIECEDDEDEEDDDIVYMGQDGTVYKKFKYGLLDEDEIELEYDDESYSFRWLSLDRKISSFRIIAAWVHCKNCFLFWKCLKEMGGMSSLQIHDV